MVYLSFNGNVVPAEEVDQEIGDGDQEDLPPSLPLRYRWAVWEQLMAGSDKAVGYSESTRQITAFDTVEDFWKTWERLPQPSELRSSRMILDVAEGFHIVDGLMVFRDGIRPQWEDEANADGGHLQFRLKASLGGGQLDEYWNNLVLGVIGATIEPVDMITGIRLVDKLIGGKGTGGSVRIEVWFSQFRNTKAVQLLYRNVRRCMGTRTLEGCGGVGPVAEVMHHTLTRHQ
eukprot:CAMPEP_0179236040 /NCGR_PEP_ID=MMETSP0797-20121207/13721_1 /TAXON_ID=47934 /ORGANISM="Dinophysis acuminata, Strain DAEP01" /LENGTH=230 /DNA_ID=CAMNT_0020943281 /DNA_START=69 /DNA_END=761 /DNA_ORIENTATION=+